VNKPILISGAGPAGLTLALALKRQGVDVRIIDMNEGPTDKSKALVIWPRTLELLDIHGCAQMFLDAGMKAKRACIIADHKPLVQVDLASAPSAYGFALMIPQAQTERLLGAELAALGIQVERGTELVSYIDAGADVEAVLRHQDGREDATSAAYLVGCDGAHSRVRHIMNAEFEGETLPSDYVLADIVLDGEIVHDEVTICLDSEGVLALFPMPHGRFRIIADLGPAMGDRSAAVTLEQVQALIDTRGPIGVTARDPVWTSHFTINERKVKDYSLGRVYLAGDSAHVHSPAGGQGMNTGMQDAFNLAWKMAMVWKRIALPSLLASYSPERSAIGTQVLANAGNLTRLTMLKNPILTELRRVGIAALSRIPVLRQRFADQLAETSLHYEHSTLNASPAGASRHPAAGERARDLVLDASDGGAVRLHEILSEGRFVVLSIGASAMQLPDDLRALATSASVESSDHYEKGHVYLIRPDAYVALGTRAGDAGPHLDKLRGLADQSRQG
jgi:2-polyprenyl-6-methoxyphenol hydroxylase-like FAD-dependent oxidoreductase